MWWLRDSLLEFWDHVNISGKVKATNFKFGTEIDGTLVMTAQSMSFRYELACKGHSTEKAQDLVT